MGRPPLGERSLTPAEKQRRYRARKAAQAFDNTTVTKRDPAVDAAVEVIRLQDENAALRKELARARADIAELLEARKGAWKRR
jgi:hypothetical protein